MLSKPEFLRAVHHGQSLEVKQRGSPDNLSLGAGILHTRELDFEVGIPDKTEPGSGIGNEGNYRYEACKKHFSGRTAGVLCRE